MSLTCPHCGLGVTLRLGAIGDNSAPVAPDVAHIGLSVVGSKAQPTTKTKRQKNDYSADFEAFWAVWPIHRDKAKAQAAFEDVLASGADLDAIIAGAADYARWLKTTTTAPKYAQGWLHDRRWEDEYDIPAGVGELDPSQVYGTPEYEARMIAEGIW